MARVNREATEEFECRNEDCDNVEDTWFAEGRINAEGSFEVEDHETRCSECGEQGQAMDDDTVVDIV